jgi:hypothetical protein
VGKSPRVPLTSGCTVSPKYTGNAREAIPTQNPATHRPAKIIGTPFAKAINKNAAKEENEMCWRMEIFFKKVYGLTHPLGLLAPTSKPQGGLFVYEVYGLGLILSG